MALSDLRCSAMHAGMRTRRPDTHPHQRDFECKLNVAVAPLSDFRSTTAMKVKTAYFLFSDEHRSSAREELQAAADDGAAKVSVAEVAKALGQRWKALTDEQRAEYKSRCEALNEAERQLAADDEEAQGEQAGEHHAKEATPLDGLLPVASVRRIMMADKEVSRVSGDGAVALTAAVDLLMGMLAQKAAGNARASKRRTLQLKDFSQVRFVAVCTYCARMRTFAHANTRELA